MRNDLVAASSADKPLGTCCEGSLSHRTLSWASVRSANSAIQDRRVLILHVAPINKARDLFEMTERDGR